MKKPFLKCTGFMPVVLFLLLPSTVFTQVTVSWVNQFVSPSTVVSRQLTLDPDSNIIVTGFLYDTTDFDTGPGTSYVLPTSGIPNPMFFIAKYNKSSNLQWCLGAPIDDFSNASPIDIATDATGNIYACGLFVGTIDLDPGPATHNVTSLSGTGGLFVVKYNAAGTYQWSFAFDFAAYNGGLRINPVNNELYIAGNLNNSTDVDPGPGTHTINATDDFFVGHYTLNGDFVNAICIGGLFRDNVYDMEIDHHGNLYLGGNFQKTVDFDPGPGTQNISTSDPFSVETDGFIASYNSNLDLNWVQTWLGGNSNNTIRNVALSPDGHLYCSGYVYGTLDLDPTAGVMNHTSIYTDFYISRFDTTGVFNWSKPFIGDDFNQCTDLCVNESNQLFVAGGYNGTLDIDLSASEMLLNEDDYGSTFIAKYDNDSLLWAFEPGRTANGGLVSVEEILLLPGNSFYMTGSFGDSCDFDPGAGEHILWADINTGNGVLALYQDNSFMPFVPEKDPETGIKIFPNPMAHTLFITPSQNGTRPMIITLYDLQGKVVHKDQFPVTGPVHINMVGLEKGMYLVRVNTGDKTMQAKVVKE